MPGDPKADWISAAKSLTMFAGVATSSNTTGSRLTPKRRLGTLRRTSRRRAWIPRACAKCSLAPSRRPRSARSHECPGSRRCGRYASPCSTERCDGGLAHLPDRLVVRRGKAVGDPARSRMYGHSSAQQLWYRPVSKLQHVPALAMLHQAFSRSSVRGGSRTSSIAIVPSKGPTASVMNT